MRLMEAEAYTSERLSDMSDAELDLLIAEIGSLDEEEESTYSDVLQQATELISNRRER